MEGKHYMKEADDAMSIHNKFPKNVFHVLDDLQKGP